MDIEWIRFEFFQNILLEIVSKNSEIRMSKLIILSQRIHEVNWYSWCIQKVAFWNSISMEYGDLELRRVYFCQL